VYKLDATGNETVLHSFTGSDGGNPSAGVIRDSAGNLYGTAGVVFKLDPAGNYTVLYTFTGGLDGGFPEAGVILDSAGNLYGTTQTGGTANAGVVYKLDPAGNQTVLYSFTGGADGANPWAGVIRDSAGNLYGTTAGGGTLGFGVVFAVDVAGHEKVLHSFTGHAGGAFPYYAGVSGDSAGNLYGTTHFGGTAGGGLVFKLDAAGEYTVLYDFSAELPGASLPFSGVVLGPGGNLWGTTHSGGKYLGGTVFVLRGVAAAQ
jgi:uncharacterized repeat protein (TIGR03803 family)